MANIQGVVTVDDEPMAMQYTDEGIVAAMTAAEFLLGSTGKEGNDGR